MEPVQCLRDATASTQLQTGCEALMPIVEKRGSGFQKSQFNVEATLSPTTHMKNEVWRIGAPYLV